MSANHPVCAKTFTLNNGDSFPAVGLGTWQGGVGTEDADALERSIVFALQSGYRLIDTAQLYGVESDVGRAIRVSGVPREEITVVTKFWSDWHHNPGEALRISLAETGLDYIDIFLMHWPCATTPAPEEKTLRIHESPTFVETWKMMEGLVGPKCRAIGVSNFTQKTLDTLLSSAKIVPAVNQVELHALNPNLKLVPYCQSKGIHVMSWSTMGGGGGGGAGNQILTDELFTKIAHDKNCSAGVVSLSWAVQRGITVIPKSGAERRITENIKLVTLDDEEMAKMNDAHKILQPYRIGEKIEALQVKIDGKTTILGWSKVDFGWEDEEGNWLT
ncbi:aldo/keto reductase [Ilyonectria robusta]|uniref:aldo/keto reductase n=1 Tax=Ilyonectria robusta TaxID=1079257 RepID=UPI001E8E2B59|nr:aldo/keto reductase [Ilyonectria robusta]KAH8738401.1 aldo/keto reductase [Ilyonectria robusta]